MKPVRKYRDVAGLAPMDRSAAMWISIRQRHDLSHPEGRADFDRELRAFVGSIKDPGLRHHYVAFVREKRAELYAGYGANRGRTKGRIPL